VTDFRRFCFSVLQKEFCWLRRHPHSLTLHAASAPAGGREAELVDRKKVVRGR
jgi:hypothetical protein